MGLCVNLASESTIVEGFRKEPLKNQAKAWRCASVPSRMGTVLGPLPKASLRVRLGDILLRGLITMRRHDRRLGDPQGGCGWPHGGLWVAGDPARRQGVAEVAAAAEFEGAFGRLTR